MIGLRHLMLATFVVACGTSTETETAPVDRTAPAAVNAPAADPEVADSARQARQAEVEAALAKANVPADAHYLLDPETGTLAMDVPPAILEEIRAQLIARGQKDGAEELLRLYDSASGHVRDEQKAKTIDAAFRAAVEKGGAR